MGNALFEIDGIDVAGLIAEHVGPRVLSASVVTFTTGARTPGELTKGRARTPNAPVTGRGFWEDYTPFQIDGQAVLLKDRKAVLIGDTFGGREFGEDDQITMEGVTLKIVRLQGRDPAAATFVYQCRDLKGPDKT